MKFYFLTKWIRRILLTLWFWTGVSIGTVLATFFVLAMYLLKPELTGHDTITFMIEKVMAGTISLWMELPGFWSFDVYYLPSHREFIREENGPFILAPNHNSMIDTFFIALLEYKKTYTYNAKYKYTPLFGQLCMAAGYIDIDTRNREALSMCTERMGKKMQEGYSLMLYPEGTRNKTPEFGIDYEKLKSGLFRISSDYGMKIMPIKLVGTEKIFRSYGIIDSGTVKIILTMPYTVAKEFDLNEEKRKFAKIINEFQTN